MSTFKKISLLAIVALASTQMYADKHNKKSKVTKPEGFVFTCNDAQMGNENEWQKKSTDKFNYNVVERVEPTEGKIIESSVDIRCGQHAFDSGITRIRTTIEPQDNQIKTTVETWTTKNPSYVTWTNAALLPVAAGAAAAIYGNAADAYNGNDYYRKQMDAPIAPMMLPSELAQQLGFSDEFAKKYGQADTLDDYARRMGFTGRNQKPAPVESTNAVATESQNDNQAN